MNDCPTCGYPHTGQAAPGDLASIPAPSERLVVRRVSSDSRDEPEVWLMYYGPGSPCLDKPAARALIEALTRFVEEE